MEVNDSGLCKKWTIFSQPLYITEAKEILAAIGKNISSLSSNGKETHASSELVEYTSQKY